MSDTDEITRLRAEVEQWKQGHAAACGLAERHMEEKHRLRAENERLRAALRPFAEAADGFDAARIKNAEEWFAYRGIVSATEAKGAITVGDLRRARAALDGQPAPSEWRPIETAPKNGSRMLLAYRNSLGKWRKVIAFYAPKLAIEQNDCGSDWCEYDEAGDRYFLPEGWYECIENWDDYSSAHMSGVEPTHWMPLPPAPGKEE